MSSKWSARCFHLRFGHSDGWSHSWVARNCGGNDMQSGQICLHSWCVAIVWYHFGGLRGLLSTVHHLHPPGGQLHVPCPLSTGQVAPIIYPFGYPGVLKLTASASLKNIYFYSSKRVLKHFGILIAARQVGRFIVWPGPLWYNCSDPIGWLARTVNGAIFPPGRRYFSRGERDGQGEQIIRDGRKLSVEDEDRFCSPDPRRTRTNPTMSSTFSGDETAPFFGFLGAAAALVFSCNI